MKPGCAKRERGAALLVLLAVISLGASWFLVSQLNAESGGIDAARKNRNAEVLNRAKQALIGHVAHRAAIGDDPGTTTVVEGKNPGSLPCPEAPANYGTSNEGVAAGNCTLPAVGRLPWRTLGLDKLVDAAGEPIWYVVSPGWALSCSTCDTVINSNSVGQLSVDGINNDAVALIIAPGPAITVAAAGACGAWAQARQSSGTPDVRNYLECENASGATFVTTGASGSFNDQVIRITVADIMPAIEAAIAHRVEREIVPQLKSVYGSAAWGLTSANPVYPYPAPFTNPTTSSYQGATSSYQVAAANYSGLLPFTSNCTTAGDARCADSFVAWNTAITPTVVQTGGVLGALLSYSCIFTANDTRARCTGDYAALTPIQLSMSVRASNVAMALRKLNPGAVTARYQSFGWNDVTATASGTLGSDGSATISANGTFPGLPAANIPFWIEMDIFMLADHALLSSSDATTGWFVRNEWYRLIYYAVARGHTAEKLPPVCPTTIPFVSSCLSVANVTPAGAQRAIMILAARSINGSARPSATLGDYLEFGNATAAYERKTVSAGGAVPVAQRFNDRIVVIDAN